MADFFALQWRAVELARAGREPEALDAIKEIQERFPERSDFLWHPEACLLARLGRGEEALARLESALAAGDLRRVRLLDDRDYDTIRADSRFQALAATVRSPAEVGRRILLTADPGRRMAPLLLVFHGRRRRVRRRQ